MSDSLNLNDGEQDERDLQIAVAGAQRLLHDDVLRQFLDEMRKVATHYAVYGEVAEVRDVNRAKTIAIDELRGHLRKMASVNEERAAADAQAKIFE